MKSLKNQQTQEKVEKVYYFLLPKLSSIVISLSSVKLHLSKKHTWLKVMMKSVYEKK